jgi:hypothetical protein
MDEYEDEEEVGGYSDDAGSDSGYAPVMASRQRFPRPGDSDDEVCCIAFIFIIIKYILLSLFLFSFLFY